MLFEGEYSDLRRADRSEGALTVAATGMEAAKVPSRPPSSSDESSSPTLRRMSSMFPAICRSINRLRVNE